MRKTILTAWSIPKKLLLLLLIICMTAAGIIVVSGLAHRDHVIREAKYKTLLLVQSIAAQQEQIVLGARQMLSTLAQLPQVQKLDPEACNELFREIVSRHPNFTTILGVAPDGNVVASSVPFVPGVNLLDRKHFQDAVRTRDFSAGEYIIGRVTKVPSLSYSFPVLDADHGLVGVIIGSFRLDAYADFVKNANLPGGSVVTIFDCKGTRLYRLPDDGNLIGKPVGAESFKLMSGALDQGEYERTGDDGTLRLFAFKRLSLAEGERPYMYVGAGIPKDNVAGGAIREMLDNLSILGFSCMAVGVLGFLLFKYVFARPIKRLVETTQQVGKGELGIRTGLPHTPDELGWLAESFDEMAELLEERSNQRRQAEEALRLSEEKFRALFRSSPGALVFASIDEGRVLDVNEGCCRLFGYSREEMIGKTGTELGIWGSPEERHAISEMIDSRGAVSDFECRLRTKAGEIRSAFMSVEIMEIENRRCMLVVVNDISERKAAEKVLGLTRFSIEHAVDPILWVGPDARLLYANEAACRSLGYSREELLSLSVPDIDPHIDMESWPALYESRKQGGSDTFETVHRHKDGTVFPVEVSLTNLVFHDAEFDFVFVKDIRGRREAERALRESEKRLQLALGASRMGVWELDLQNGAAFWSPECYDILGMKESDGPIDFTRIGQLERILQVMAAASRSSVEGSVYEEEFKTVWPETGERWISILGRAEYDVNGMPLRLTGTIQDITRRKRMENDLRASEEMFRLLVENAPDSIHVQTRGNFAYVNPAAMRLLGAVSREQLLGRSVLDTMDPAFHEEVRERIHRANIERRYLPPSEQRLIRLDGTSVDVEASGVPIVYENRNGALVFMRDISERKRAEDEREQLERQLRQAQKTEAIGTLAGGIAHDFNNILVPVMGYTEMVLNEVPPGSTTHTHLQQVLNAANHAKDLVKQILAIGRHGQEQEKKPLDIGVVVREAMNLLRATLPTTIEIRQEIGTCVASADPTQIHQVMLNLCMNAAHAMNNRGILDVSLRPCKLDQADLAVLSIMDLNPGRYLKLAVTDTGCGMDKATLDRIFDPYFTTKEVGKGSGLGLAVVHGIVKRHDGAVSVRSKPDEGSTFCIYLPEIEAKARSAADAAQTLPKGSERILLVDDEKTVMDLGARMLERLGYHVTAESGSVRALEVFRSRPDDFDLVVSDYTMPNLTGIDLALEIRRIRPDKPIILCTGFSERLNETTARELGVGLMMKPFGIKQAADIVRKTLDARKDPGAGK